LVRSRSAASRLELRRIGPLFGFSLGELKFVRERVDLGEQGAFVNLLAFLKMNLEQLPLDATADGHGVERRDGADRPQVHWEAGFSHFDGAHGHRLVAPAGAPRATARFRGNSVRKPKYQTPRPKIKIAEP
jgi:hypothetical protein